MRSQSIVAVLGIVLSVCSCNAGAGKSEGEVPVDTLATEKTVQLYRNLFKIPEQGIMFGHQDATLYGIGWKNEAGRSDVKSVCGDYPAVYGWEIGHIELGASHSLDSVDFSIMRREITEAYNRGGLNTISWHCDNPLTGGNTWDVSSKEVVKSVLPGGEKHELYLTWLDQLASFLNSLETEQGEKIPVLFRPYHEHTGSWFWWGKDLCSPEDYKTLFRFTVDYLKKKEIHHLLYIYSPDNAPTAEAYFERYPGDDYVDILGLDCYHHQGETGAEQYMNSLKTIFSYLVPEAQQRHKPLVFSETGSEALPMSNWWTDVLLNTISSYPITYVLVWRNAYEKPNHYFGPYPGQLSSDNFKTFHADKKTLFQSDIKDLYK